MKVIRSLGFVFIFGCCVMSLSYAYAAGGAGRIFVNLSPTSVCNASGKQNGIVWTGACNGSVIIRGVGMCSSTVGTSIGQTSIPLLNDSGALYCWCKMFSPVNSVWVFSGMKYSDTNRCAQNCAVICGTMVGFKDAPDGPNFRAGMFSRRSMTD